MAKLNKKLRQEIYNKYDGHCAYCGCEIEMKDMQIDHIVPKYRNNEMWHQGEIGSDEISNLNPSCRMCNFYKGMYSIDIFRGNLKEPLCVMFRDHLIFALLKGMGWLRLRSGMGNFTLKERRNSYVSYHKIPIGPHLG